MSKEGKLLISLSKTELHELESIVAGLKKTSPNSIERFANILGRELFHREPRIAHRQLRYTPDKKDPSKASSDTIQRLTNFKNKAQILKVLIDKGGANVDNYLAPQRTINTDISDTNQKLNLYKSWPNSSAKQEFLTEVSSIIDDLVITAQKRRQYQVEDMNFSVARERQKILASLSDWLAPPENTAVPAIDPGALIPLVIARKEKSSTQ